MEFSGGGLNSETRQKQQERNRLLLVILDKKIQIYIVEFKSKQRLGYQIIEDLDRPTKLIIVYEQTIILSQEELPKQLQPRYKLEPFPQNFLEKERLSAKELRETIDKNWFDFLNKATHSKGIIGSVNANREANNNEGNNIPPTGE